MCIANKLKNIINCKNAIRTSINNKGGKITENSKFSDYATAINNLSAGGGSGVSSVDLMKHVYINQKTPVVNTDHLEKIFFDTSLTTEQVDSIIANPNLTFGVIGGDMHLYIILITQNFMLAILDYSQNLNIESGSAWAIGNLNSNTIYYVSPAVAERIPDPIPVGWNEAAFTNYDTGEVNFGIDLAQGDGGFEANPQNNLITELVYIPSLVDSGETELAKSLTDRYKLVEQKLVLSAGTNTSYNYDFINNINESTKEISIIKNITVNSKESDIIDKSITTYTNNNVKEISYYAFAFCTLLTDASFPNVKIIRSNAFYNCNSLVNINMPLVEDIGSDTFAGCSHLIDINLPLVTSIGNSAFSGCTALKSITAPLVEQLGAHAFENCYYLENIALPEVSFVDNYFNYNYRLKEIDLSKAVHISAESFKNCASLVKLFIAQTDKVCTLENTNAFTYCCHILGTTDSNYNPNGLKDGYIYVPASLLAQYKVATNWSTYASQIIGHEYLEAGVTLPSYTTTSFTKQTWYSDEKLTTAVTSVATSGTYYCKLYN